MKRFLAVLMAAAWLLVMLPVAVAHSAENYIDLSWDGEVFSQEAKESFVASNMAIPGDDRNKSVTIKNTGPNDGILKVWLVNVTAQPDANDAFFKDIQLYVRGETGDFRDSMSKLATASNGATPAGSMSLARGASTELTVGYEYPYNDNTYNSGAKVYKEGRFDVRLELSGDYLPGKLTLEIIPHINDLNGNGLADLNEEIRWEFKVKNTGDSKVTNIKIVSAYLSDRGITVVCPKADLEPGEEMSCWATSKVLAVDVNAGKISLEGVTNGVQASSETAFASERFNVNLKIAKPPVTNPDPGTDPDPGNPVQLPVDRVTDRDPISLPKDKSCRELGRSNIPSHDPEYRLDLDSDRDGIACETDGRIDTGMLVANRNLVLMAIGGLLMGSAIILLLYMRRRESEEARPEETV